MQICQQTEIQKQPTYPALKLTQMGRKFILNFYENMLKDLTKKKKRRKKRWFIKLDFSFTDRMETDSSKHQCRHVGSLKNNIYCTACFSPGYSHIINANVVISDIS